MTAFVFSACERRERAVRPSCRPVSSARTSRSSSSWPVLAAAATQSGSPPSSQPDTEIDTNGNPATVLAWLRPSFVSARYGDPGYGLLATYAPVQITTGAEDGAEMGAFHMVQAARREANLRAALDEYLRFGLEAGIFYAS